MKTKYYLGVRDQAGNKPYIGYPAQKWEEEFGKKPEESTLALGNIIKKRYIKRESREFPLSVLQTILQGAERK